MLSNDCITMVSHLCLFHLPMIIPLSASPLPIFPSLIVSTPNLFDSPFDVLFPFLSIIENLRNNFPSIVLFLPLADEKYVFAVLPFRTNPWLYCLFLFIVTNPYTRQELPRSVICPQKEQNLVTSLLLPVCNCPLECIKRDAEKLFFSVTFTYIPVTCDCPIGLNRKLPQSLAT